MTHYPKYADRYRSFWCVLYCWMFKGHDYHHLRGSRYLEECSKCGWGRINHKDFFR